MQTWSVRSYHLDATLAEISIQDFSKVVESDQLVGLCYWHRRLRQISLERWVERQLPARLRARRAARALHWRARASSLLFVMLRCGMLLLMPPRGGG